MNRVIVIADLHGCLNEANALLKKCEAKYSDHVIFLGDLVDRGPDSAGCIDLAMTVAKRQGKPAAILGNHEDKMLYYRRKDEAGKDPKVGVPSHIATRAQLRDEHYEYMKRLPLFLRLPEHNAAVVHAGVFPGRSLEAQDREHLLHIQMINPSEGTKSMWPSKAPEGWKFWTHFWDGPERIIFGHSVFDKPLVTEKVCGIDGGACFGRQLHAVILPEWRIVSVQGEADHGKGRRGTSAENIEMFLVHGDVSTYS